MPNVPPRADRIDSWDRHDASATFESADNRWELKAWVRNIEDDNVVTGHALATDDLGAFRFYFLAEPRIFGASIRYNFGV